jgi:hypothetical protein
MPKDIPIQMIAFLLICSCFLCGIGFLLTMGTSLSIRFIIYYHIVNVLVQNFYRKSLGEIVHLCVMHFPFADETYKILKRILFRNECL